MTKPLRLEFFTKKTQRNQGQQPTNKSAHLYKSPHLNTTKIMGGHGEPFTTPMESFTLLQIIAHRPFRLVISWRYLVRLLRVHTGAAQRWEWYENPLQISTQLFLNVWSFSISCGFLIVFSHWKKEYAEGGNSNAKDMKPKTHPNKQTNKQTDRQTDKQTNK